jgi:hypothetical protein
MYKVLVKLVGEPLDITALKSQLIRGDWKALEQEDGTFLTSNVLDKLTDAREIESMANQFLDTFNGALNVIYRNHKKVGTGVIKQKAENGGYNITVIIDDTIELRDRLFPVTLSKGSEASATSLTIGESWFTTAEKDSAVRDVLHFFNDLTWWNLYKIYEIIRDDVKDQKRLNKLINRKRLSHFTQSAQSRDSLGDAARHASKKYKPPPSHLSLNDATDIIIELFTNWIATK